MRTEIKILLTASGLSVLATQMVGPVYAVFVENVGGDLSTAGYAYGVLAVVAGIVTFLMGHWADRLGHERLLVVAGYVLSSLGVLGYIFVSEPSHLYAVQVVMGLASAVRSPSFDSIYSKYLHKGKYASEWGAWETMYWFATAASAAIGGFIADSFGFHALFSVMFGLSLIGVFASTFLLLDHTNPNG